MARAASGPAAEGSFRSFLGLQQQRGWGLRSVVVSVALLLAASAADARLLPLEGSLEAATGGGGAARRLLECGQCPPAGEPRRRGRAAARGAAAAMQPALWRAASERRRDLRRHAGEAQSRCQALGAGQRDSMRNSLLASCPGPALSGARLPQPPAAPGLRCAALPAAAAATDRRRRYSAGGCCAALPAQGTADWEDWAACMW